MLKHTHMYIMYNYSINRSTGIKGISTTIIFIAKRIEFFLNIFFYHGNKFPVAVLISLCSQWHLLNNLLGAVKNLSINLVSIWYNVKYILNHDMYGAF